MSTTAVPVTVRTPVPSRSLRRTLRLGAQRVTWELRRYRRTPSLVFFSFLFPVLMYTLFAGIFSGLGEVGDPRGGVVISQATAYLPGMLASGLLLTGVQGLGIDLATDRHDGTLALWRSTSLPYASYLLGKLGVVVIAALVQGVLILGIARGVFGVQLPEEPLAWARIALFWTLGLLSCTALGVLLGQLPRSARSASSLLVPCALVLQFLSGVYIAFSLIPGWAQTLAGIFPLRWIALGLRAGILPESFAAVEPGAAWNLLPGSIILMIWAGGSVALLAIFSARKEKS